MRELLLLLALIAASLAGMLGFLALYWYHTRRPPAAYGTWHGRAVYIELDSNGEDRAVEIHPDTDLVFERANGDCHPALIGLVMDGMSGHWILWPIIGGPFNGKGRKTWPIHDSLCALQQMPYQEAHRIAYEGCEARGMWFRAKLVYAGLMLFGTRWPWPPAAASR